MATDGQIHQRLIAVLGHVGDGVWDRAPRARALPDPLPRRRRQKTVNVVGQRAKAQAVRIKPLKFASQSDDRLCKSLHRDELSARDLPKAGGSKNLLPAGKHPHRSVLGATVIRGLSAASIPSRPDRVICALRSPVRAVLPQRCSS